MSTTIAAPGVRQGRNSGTTAARPVPVWKLVEAWAAMIPLLFFTARGTFSFDGASGNNAMATYGMLMAPSINDARHNVELIAFYGILCLLLIPFYKTVIAGLFENKLIAALPLLAIVSAVWSQAPSRSITFGVTALLNAAFALYLVNRFSRAQQLQLLVMLGTITLLISYFLIGAFPRIGLDHKEGLAHAWQGMFGHKNHAGMVMIYLLIPILCLELRSNLQRASRGLYVIATLLLIVMSQSRTAWLLLVFTLGCSGIVKLLKRYAPKDRLVLTVFIVTAAILLCVAGFFEEANIAIMLGKDPTLTGRTEIWAAVMHPIMKRPLLGYGYDAFWIGFKGEAAVTAMMVGAANLGNAENGVLQVWLELGAVGVLLVFLQLYQITRMGILCFSRDASKYIQWCLTVVFLSLAMLVDGDKFMFPHTLEWILFVMVYATLHKELKARRLVGRRE